MRYITRILPSKLKFGTFTIPYPFAGGKLGAKYFGKPFFLPRSWGRLRRMPLEDQQRSFPPTIHATLHIDLNLKSPRIIEAHVGT